MLPMPQEATAGSGEAEQMGLGVFRGRVPVPMQYPGGSMVGERPWFFMAGEH